MNFSTRELLQAWLSIDDWQDDLIAPAWLVDATRLAVGADSGVGSDADAPEETPRFTNLYSHCETEWQDEWSCQCNDSCPVCGAEIEPYKSIEI